MLLLRTPFPIHLHQMDPARPVFPVLLPYTLALSGSLSSFHVLKYARRYGGTLGRMKVLSFSQLFRRDAMDPKGQLQSFVYLSISSSTEISLRHYVALYSR